MSLFGEQAHMRLLMGGGFVGAYDAIPNIIAAYGMRRLLSSYESNLIRIRRNSDQVESDFGYVANGDLDVAAVATFLSATTGQITTWYDQKNSNNVTQTTAAAQPLYVASGQNSLPVVQWQGTDDWMSVTMTVAQPGQVIVVARNTGSSSPLSDGVSGFRWAMGQNLNGGGNDEWGLFAGSVLVATQAGIHNTWQVHNGLFNGASSQYRANGALVVAGDAGAQGITSLRLGRNSGSFYLTGYMAEVIVCNAALSAGDNAAAEAVANSYWAVY